MPVTTPRNARHAGQVPIEVESTTAPFDYSQLSRVADRLLTPVAVIAPDSTLRYANREVGRILGVDVTLLIGQRMLDLVHPDDSARVTQELADILLEGLGGGFTRLRLRHGEDHGWRIVDAYAHNLQDDPHVAGVLISGSDVTEEENLTRALKSFSDVTRILIHARDEKELMSAVCDSVIANGEYLVAWVGYAQDDADKTVELVAASGQSDCLSNDLTRWDDSDWGRGPTGEAIRTRSAQVVNEPGGSQRYDAWREQMDVYGVRSVCSLPLVIDERRVGALTIYSQDPHKFGAAEMAVLSDYADELSFGLRRLCDVQRLERNESQLRQAERLTHVGHWEWELRTNRLEFMADEIYAIYGTDPERWGATLESFLAAVPDEERADVRLALERSVVEGSAELTHRVHSATGGTRYLHVRTEVVVDEDARPVRVLGTSLDITDTRLAQEQIENSREFLLAITDNMNEGMLATDAEGRITFVNAAASRLLGADPSGLMGSPVAARFRRDPTWRGAAEDGADVAGPLEGWTRDRALTVEHCVARRDDGSTVSVALNASPLVADGIKGSVVVFEDISSHVVEQRRVERELDKLAWVGRIRDALDEGRFELFAQPVIDLTTTQTVQHELLIRMRSANGDLVEPAMFLATAEEFGLISDIDRWVITETARVAAQGHRVAFNLSARSVADPRTLSRIRDAIHIAGASPELIECEITETALVHDVAAAEALVRGLIQLGCSVALDDFGVGYGGFAYLKRLPVSVLKIDREFVRDLCDEASSRHVVAAVVSLARAFTMTTTAEGPETPECLELLRGLGVDRAQGFVIGRPSPLAEAFDDGVRPTN